MKTYFAELTPYRTYALLAKELEVVTAFTSSADAETYAREHNHTHPWLTSNDRVRAIAARRWHPIHGESTTSRFLVVSGPETSTPASVFDAAPDASRTMPDGLILHTVALFPVGPTPRPPAPTPTDREYARLAADVVLFAGPAEDRHVLLIQRGWPPYEGAWALPGGHVDGGETTLDAARRELREETGVLVTDLVEVGTYSDPGRDPRGRYISTAYTATLPTMLEATAGDDASAATWVPVTDVRNGGYPMAFDHRRILSDALSRTDTEKAER